MADVHEAVKAMTPDTALKLVSSLYVLSDKHGTPSDTLALLDFMLVALPDNPALVAAKARVYLMTYRLNDAVYLLEKNLELNPDNAMVTAMLALAPYAKKDSRWESTLREAIESGDDDVASNIAKELSGRSGIEFQSSEARGALSTFPVDYNHLRIVC